MQFICISKLIIKLINQTAFIKNLNQASIYILHGINIINFKSPFLI
jgi:hypothetical protein